MTGDDLRKLVEWAQSTSGAAQMRVELRRSIRKLGFTGPINDLSYVELKRLHGTLTRLEALTPPAPRYDGPRDYDDD